MSNNQVTVTGTGLSLSHMAYMALAPRVPTSRNKEVLGPMRVSARVRPEQQRD
jgi:hypothetical protein